MALGNIYFQVPLEYKGVRCYSFTMPLLSSPKPTNPMRVSGFFSPESPIEFIGFTVMTTMLGLMSAGNWLGFVFIPIFATAWWIFDQRRQRKRLQSARFVVTKEHPRPARGLILLLSPYNVRNLEVVNPTQLERHLQYLLTASKPTAEDFTNIGILHSNLLPQIKAIEYHLRANKLEEIWLLSTASYSSVKGSAAAAAPILEKYLRHCYGKTIPKIYRQKHPVKEYDYASLWQLAEKIFQDSAYKDEVIVADITGGNKMMSIALALACIPVGRRMQYMDTRNWQGEPLSPGHMAPIAIDIDPITQRDH